MLRRRDRVQQRRRHRCICESLVVVVIAWTISVVYTCAFVITPSSVKSRRRPGRNVSATSATKPRLLYRDACRSDEAESSTIKLMAPKSAITTQVAFLRRYSCLVPSRRQRQTRLFSVGENSAANVGSMRSALAIVPPDEAWDSIQRARHFTRDATLYRWPPAIRLFHPFTDCAALRVGKIVEACNITSFEITLDSLLIVPHTELLEQERDAATRFLPHTTPTHRADTPMNRRADVERQKVKDLIDREERVGKAKHIRRIAVEKRKQKESASFAAPLLDNNEGMKHNSDDVGGADAADGNEDNGKDNNDDADSNHMTPYQLMDKQKRQSEQFNGPCVLCLEPNAASKEKICQLRELIRTNGFEDYDGFSVSSAVSSSEHLPRIVAQKHKRGETTFRPVLTIGSFSTVSKAVKIAKKLQQLWEPLSFNVTELHLISRMDQSATLLSSLKRKENNKTLVTHTQSNEPLKHDNRECVIPAMSEVSESSLSSSALKTMSSPGEFGCDALIMLMGEEGLLLQADDEIGNHNEETILDLLMSNAGISGGGDAALSYNQSELLPNNDDYVEKLLCNDCDEEEDGWDEGATVVIGRMQFFTGDMRQYVGMPASSSMDAKDRVLGEGVSAAARRRGAVHRQGDRWQIGDFGQKDRDYLP